MDGRDVSFDDALYMGQTEMGHIGPKVDRPIFLCAVKAKRQDSNDGNRWSIVHCMDSGEPQYRANDAEMYYDGLYLQYKDTAEAIALLSVNLLSRISERELPSCYWSVRMLYVATTDALTNLGPILVGDRIPLAAAVNEWAAGYLYHIDHQDDELTEDERRAKRHSQ